MADGSIGMMNGSYFVDRHTLLSWINGLLQTSYGKVEQLGNGAAYCQIIDAIHPGKVRMERVKFNAIHEYEFVANFKVLQEAFARIGIERHIETEKLVRCKYLDNLEFLQWMKAYFDRNFTGGEYDAVARRERSGAGGPPPGPRSTPQAASSQKRAAQPSGRARVPGSAGRPTGVAAPTGRVTKAANDKHAHEVAELRKTIQTLETERAFYFNKLRAIEVYTQEHEKEENETIAAVQAILYAPDAPAVDEEGNTTE